MRPAAFFGLLGLAIALGGIVAGRLVVLPGLGHHPELIDANFAKALSAPLHLRLAEIVLAGHLVVAALSGLWIGARWATTLGLLLVACSGAHRFLLLPALYTAWSRADLVAGRPVEHILTAQRYELYELGLLGAMVLLHTMLVGAHVLTLRRVAEPAAAPAMPETATSDQEPSRSTRIRASA
jgi:hypothetical protein